MLKTRIIPCLDVKDGCGALPNSDHSLYYGRLDARDALLLLQTETGGASGPAACLQARPPSKRPFCHCRA